jgi:hypothetical protein
LRVVDKTALAVRFAGVALDDERFFEVFGIECGFLG